MAPPPIDLVLDAPWFPYLAVALLTLPYWASGMAKLLDWGGALAEAEELGLHPAMLTVAGTIAVQLGGSALLISGWMGWLGAGALGVFTVIATLIAHPFWRVSEPAAHAHQRNMFLTHVGLVGGLMAAAILVHRHASG